MKKLISVLLISLIICSTFLFSSCVFDKVPTVYSDPEKYTAGNTEFEGKVDNLSIWWQYGTVTVKTHKENTVKITETANRELDEKFTLHWRYFNASDYGMVLYVQFSASGNFDFGDLKKDLVVYLPENEDMDIAINSNAASVDLDVSEFENNLEELHVFTISGKVSVKIDSADEVWISGQNDEGVPEENREFCFRANGTVSTLGISASYAKVDAYAKKIYNGEIMTVYADLLLEADEARDLKLYNSEGKICATVLNFRSLDIETNYQPCELTLSPDASFVLSIKEKNRFNQNMTPKSVTVEFENMTQSGSQYTVGTGENEISIATDSDIVIIPLADHPDM